MGQQQQQQRHSAQYAAHGAAKYHFDDSSYVILSYCGFGRTPLAGFFLFLYIFVHYIFFFFFTRVLAARPRTASWQGSRCEFQFATQPAQFSISLLFFSVCLLRRRRSGLRLFIVIAFFYCALRRKILSDYTNYYYTHKFTIFSAAM